MFTPILGRVSVQNESPSPGAWAQIHPDNKLNTITTARRHPIFTLANEFFVGLYPGPDTCWKEHRINCCHKMNFGQISDRDLPPRASARHKEQAESILNNLAS